MKLVQIVLLAGSHCVSPAEHMQGLSEISKVPCAVIVKRDTETNAVTTEPPGLAALPEVVAILAPAIPAASRPKPVLAHRPPAPVVQIVPVSDTAAASDLPEAEAVPKPRKVAAAATKAPAAGSRKRQAAKARLDRCGSYKAIWYTAKSGARRYRCVRQG